MTSKNTSSDIFSQILDRVRDTVSFVPNNEQKRARSNFWIAVGELGIDIPQQVGLPVVLQHAGDKRVAEWWVLPGFQDWFLNREDFRQRVDFLSSMALDELEKTLQNPAASPKDKILVAKMLLDERNRRVAASDGADASLLGERLQKMSRAELDTYIRTRVQKLTPSTEEPSDA